MVAFVVAAVAFLAVAFVVTSAFGVSKTRQTLLEKSMDAYVPLGADRPTKNVDILRTQRRGMVSSLDKLVENSSFAERIALDLIRADLPLRPGEYVAIHVGLAVALFAVASLALANALIGVVAIPLSFLAMRLFVTHRQQKIVTAFEAQLPEAIDLINTSMKSGFGLLQGLETVAKEMPRPIKDEFAQIIRDISLGMQLDDALGETCKRVASNDVYLMVTAILVHKTVGGNLSEVLTGISNTIRARIRLREEVHALTTTPRVSSYVISALPILFFVLVSLTNPGYLTQLLTTEQGHVMLGIAGGLMAVGLLLSSRLTKIDY